MESTSVLNNRYRLLAQVAAGGMAVVYKAQDMLLNRVVAVKILRESFAADPTFQARFRREAEAAANLNHVNIVTVYDVGNDGGRYYIVMEYVDGQDLKQIIRFEAPLPIQRAVDITIQICAALGAAHRAGLVHCDVKPQNVLVTTDGRVKVTDFGIARVLSQASSHITDTVWGTPHYISPEQAAGESPTPASDVYAAGVVLYEMLAGRLPFEGETHTQLALAHMRDEPPPLASFNPAVPPHIEQIVRKVMSKEPAARYRTAEQLATILVEYRHVAEQSTGFQAPVRQLGQTVTRAPIRDVTPPPDQADGFDWLGWLLGGLAAIALVGLIPLWLIVLRAYAAPSPTTTPTPPAPLETQAPDITVPLGNDQISVPNVVGQPREQAILVLNGAGLRVAEGAPRFSGSVPAGNVIEQFPKANEPIARNSVILINISNGPQVSPVPNVIGLVLTPDIEEGLKQGGWNIIAEEEYSLKPYHEILGLVPAPFTPLAAGEPLTLTLSGGVTLTLGVRFSNLIQLDGALLPTDQIHPGESVNVTFLWRALSRLDTPYIRFIHFIDEDGNIQAQDDLEPSTATTLWPRNEVIYDQHTLPTRFDLPPGEYRLLVGFYPVGRPADRLPITDLGESEGESERVNGRALIKTITVVP